MASSPVKFLDVYLSAKKPNNKTTLFYKTTFRLEGLVSCLILFLFSGFFKEIKIFRA